MLFALSNYEHNSNIDEFLSSRWTLSEPTAAKATKNLANHLLTVRISVRLHDTRLRSLVLGIESGSSLAHNHVIRDMSVFTEKSRLDVMKTLEVNLASTGHL
jgi:hypothetical protein